VAPFQHLQNDVRARARLPAVRWRLGGIWALLVQFPLCDKYDGEGGDGELLLFFKRRRARRGDASGHALAGAMPARTAVPNVIVGKPSVLEAIVAEIREHAYEKGRIGIVEYDPYISLPKNQWDHFTVNLPQAEVRRFSTGNAWRQPASRTANWLRPCTERRRSVFIRCRWKAG